MWLNAVLGIGLVVAGVVLLVRGADWFMDSVADLAREFGMSALVLGILLASLEPEEMLTAAIASFRGNAGLAVGNVVGSNIVITTFALGLSALISPVVIGFTIRRQAIVATLVSIVPIGLMYTGSVGRAAGLVMLAAFVGYSVFLVWRSKADLDMHTPISSTSSEIETDERGDESRIRPQRMSAKMRLTLLTLAGLIAMTLGGWLLVEGALKLADTFGLAEGVMGATIVSMGTGAEMIALGISAARKRRTDILVGGIAGSFAYNLLATLGLAAVIHPLTIDMTMRQIALPIMIVAHIVLLILVWRGKIERWVGGLLIVGYFAYLVVIVLPGR